MATQEHPKTNLSSNLTRKVRIVAKIRPFTPQESQSQSSKPWISISKSKQSDRVALSFTSDNPTSSRKEVYEVDHCYEQNEGTDSIFSREIKHLFPDILNGKKATFIGFGARGSGKTYAIQGCDDIPGLATLTITEILPMAEEDGKFVTVSIYEAFQDHVYDILDPNRPEVQVLESAQGKIKLKGLSQVSVKSVTEFQKLYHGRCSAVKATQETGLEQPRSHKGLMINILSRDETSNMKLVGKINFIDLAGYEDYRRKGKNSSESIGLNNAESSKINKSLYAFLNVVYALNANENRVPYRESKLTRVLQDSLGGTNHVLILTCMNPLVCQDTAYSMSLASRACQRINQVLTDSTNRSKSFSKPTVASLMSKSSSKPTVVSSMSKSSSKPTVVSSMSKSSSKPTVVSSMKAKPVSLSATTKKQTNCQVNLSRNKSRSTIEGKKLFVDRNQSVTSEQENSATEVPLDKRELTTTVEEETLSTCVLEKRDLTITVDEEISLSSVLETKPISIMKKDLQMEENHIEDTLHISNDIKALTLFEGDSVQNEANNVVADDGGSPPLSARLKELSNNLKSLCSSTPLCETKPQEVGTPYVDCVEPKTPAVERDNDKRAITKFESPRGAFSARSSGMKQSLVQGYLQFLNSASKEDLKGLRGIGEKRATYILELREESPEPFKSLDDLRDIGMSEKQIKGMMKTVAGELLFS